MKKKFIVIGVIIILIIIIIFAVKKLLPKGENMPGVDVEKVSSRSIINEVSVSGTVALAESNRFYSSSSATIKEIYIKEGDSVKEGQTLFTYNEKALDNLKNQLAEAKLDVKDSEIALKAIDIDADQSEIKEVKAQISQYDTSIKSINYKIEQFDVQINQAEKDLNKAKEDYENNKLLYNSGGLSLEDLKVSENEYNQKSGDLTILNSQKSEQKILLNSEEASKDAACAKYDKLINYKNTEENKNKREAQRVALQKAQLKVTQLQDEINKFKTEETAPWDGVIINLQEDFMSGSAISEGTYLFEIADKNTVINLDVPEYDMQNVALNQPVTINYDGFEGELKGTVTKIYPTAEKKTINNSEKNVVTVQVSVSNKNNLNLGFNVEGKITTNINENALVIPISSYLTDNNGNDYVYTVDNNGIIKKKYITIKTFDNMYIEIEGLNIGETVVKTPDETLISDGFKVSINEVKGND